MGNQDYKHLDGDEAVAGYPAVAVADKSLDLWSQHRCFLIFWLVMSAIGVVLFYFLPILATLGWIACILGIVGASIAVCNCCCPGNPRYQAHSVFVLAMISFIFDVIGSSILSLFAMACISDDDDDDTGRVDGGDFKMKVRSHMSRMKFGSDNEDYHHHDSHHAHHYKDHEDGAAGLYVVFLIFIGYTILHSAVSFAAMIRARAVKRSL